MRVLIVDDEGSLLLTLAANLELASFEVAEANSGKRALELFQKENFDVVLSDIRMPGMNGIDLFREIRRMDQELPVVLMTAFELEEQVEAALGEGVFTIVAKPFRIEHIVNTLKRALYRPVVLVAFDTPRAAQAPMAALHAAGLSAVAAADEEDALQLVREGKVDVCVVVITARDPNPEVIAHVLAFAPTITCIAVVEDVILDVIRQAAALGASACLRLPLNSAELIREIARARGPLQAARAF